MMKQRFVKLSLVAASVYSCGAANADHTTHLHSIDAIDHTFPAGGGSYTGSVSSTTDDAWVVFGANAGDTLDFSFRSIGGSFMTAAVLLEVQNGIVEVGDAADIHDFNSDKTGFGTDLVVQHGPLIDGTCSGFYCFDTAGGSFSFEAAATGQYVIGVSSANESQATQFDVVMSGNTLTVPEAATIAPLCVCLLILSSQWLRSSRSSHAPNQLAA